MGLQPTRKVSTGPGRKTSSRRLPRPQISFAPAGAESCQLLPTADAVGYGLPPLPGLGHTLQDSGTNNRTEPPPAASYGDLTHWLLTLRDTKNLLDILLQD